MIEVEVKKIVDHWKFFTKSDEGKYLPVFPEQAFETKVDAIVWFMNEYPETAETEGIRIYWHLFSGIETH